MMEVIESSKVFKPKYELGMNFSAIFIPIMTVVSIFVVVKLDLRELPAYGLIALFSILTLSMPFTRIRQIRFSDKMYVDQFILAPREIDYKDIIDVGIITVKTKRGNISLYKIENTKQFYEFLKDAMAQNQVSESQLEGKLAKREVISWTSSIYAQLIAIPITLLLVWWSPTCIKFLGKFTFLTVFLAIFAPIYWIVRHRSQ
jgi:hypothetical protein